MKLSLKALLYAAFISLLVPNPSHAQNDGVDTSKEKIQQQLTLALSIHKYLVHEAKFEEVVLPQKTDVHGKIFKNTDLMAVVSFGFHEDNSIIIFVNYSISINATTPKFVKVMNQQGYPGRFIHESDDNSLVYYQILDPTLALAENAQVFQKAMSTIEHVNRVFNTIFDKAQQ